MSISTKDRTACYKEEIIAYLDGELNQRSIAFLEHHLVTCDRCTVEYRLQQRLVAELENALIAGAGVELPRNFAQVVAARAQSDLRGVREPRERRRAFGLCGVLLILSVALLGGAAASESVLAPARLIWRSAAALFSFLGHALYSAGAGMAVLSRGVGSHLFFESWPFGLLIIVLFASALIMLRRLIVEYHRTRISL
ncbi:MAG: hypothetical protein QOJ64_2262 [Acidobacteriota bacterium]|nr:hypothetical protein [Acidobacteriota bacterium]